jgi:hypothetical protein
MKKSLLITAIVLLTQANSAFAAGKGGTILEINKRATRILDGSTENLDTLTKEMRDADSVEKKMAIGKKLLNNIEVSKKIGALGSTLGLTSIRDVVVAMPQALRSLLFIQLTREQIVNDSSIEQTPKGRLSAQLHGIFSKIRIGLKPTKEAEAMNNLLENAPGMVDALLPFVEGLNRELETGVDFSTAFTRTAETLLKKYNAKNTDKRVDIKEFIEMLKKCTTLPG